MKLIARRPSALAIEIAAILALKVAALMYIHNTWFDAPSPWDQSPESISQHLVSPSLPLDKEIPDDSR